MKKFYLLFCLTLLTLMGNSQLLFKEAFDYPVSATLGLSAQSGATWLTVNSGDSILLDNGSLTYPGLEASTGNKIKFDGAGADYYRTFATQTSGTVYSSFILNLSSTAQTSATGTYFTGLIQGASTTSFGATVWIKTGSVAGTYNIGINTRTTSTAVTWINQDLLPNTPYFIVTAYDIITGTANDIARIWLNTTAIGGAEPAATATAVPATDLLSVGRYLLRQADNLSTPFIEMDEIRVGTTWESVTPSATIATPTVTSISPTAATAGGADFTLTVTGTNFVSGQSSITWNGSTRTTTFVSATELTTTITAADIATAGTATVGVTTTGAASPSNTITFTINAAATPVLSTSGLADFGNVCINTTAGPNSFTITGTDLTNADITVGALSGFTYSTSAAGPYSTTLTLSQPGGSYSQQVFVQFTPTAVQSYNGNIVVSGGGAAATNVAVTAAGVNTAPSVTTGSATSVTHNSATLSGTITNTGCGTVTAYGFEYSTTNNFTAGTGTIAASTNLSAGIFSADLTGLSPLTIYYYRAFATNDGGTTYGAQASFTSLQVPAPVAPVATAATDITPSSFTANWNAVAGATNYFLDVYTIGSGSGTAVISGWNFDVNNASNQIADSGNVNNIGIQAISDTGLNVISWPGGPTNTTGLNPYSVSGNGWDNGADAKYWIIDVNTTGLTNITLSSLQGSSGTGVRDFKIQYKVGASGTWTDVPGGTVTITSNVSPGNAATWFGPTDLALPADADNQSLVSIRWIMTSNTSVSGGTVSATGTSRISAIYVKGNFTSSSLPIYVAGYQNLNVGNVTSYPVTGLSPNTNYYYVVRAANAGGTSASSNEISVTTAPAPTPVVTAGTVSDFGSVIVGNVSASQSFTVSGVNLQGAPGNLTVTAPSTDFQVSNDNTTWGATTTIAYTSGTLTATNVYVRFTPQSAGVKSGNLLITGGGLSSPVTVAVSGTGLPVPPPVAPVATAATSVTTTGFTANWNAVTGATHYFLDVYRMVAGSSVQTIAGWNFLTNTAISQTADAGNSNNIGIQTISGVGLNVISWPGGPTPSTGANPYSVSANGWDNGADTKYWTLNVNTTGVSNVTVSSLQGASNTGPKDFKLQYKVGTSGTWTDVPGGTVTNTVAVAAGNAATWTALTDVALPAAADNQPLVSLRWIMTSNTAVNGSPVSATGTSRISAIYIKGNSGTGTSIAYVPGYQNLNVGNVTSYNVTGLTDNTTYYYVVRAANAGGVSPNSNEITVTTLVDVTPKITTTTVADFGNVCVNATSAAHSFVITGANLTNEAITVGPLAGYTFSTTATGTYTSSLTLTQSGGSYSQTIYVKFTPTAVSNYNGNIVVSGGGISTPVNVAVTGAGINTAATVTTGGATSVTDVSAVAAGNITATGCSAVTAYGIEYSITTGFTSGTQVPSTNLSGTSFTSTLTGLTPATTYYYKAYATNSGGTTYGAEQSFTTLALPPASLTATTVAAFGNVCVNNASAAGSFTLTGTALTNENIVVGPLAGYSFSTSATGTFTPTLSLTQAGGAYSQVVYVKLTPTAVQSYNGNIPVSGGGVASAINVAVTGAGVNTTATVTTATATGITSSTATVGGSVTNIGCSAVSAFGIEYSTVNGFTTGTRINASGSADNFSITLNGLMPGVTYYYKAFATNAGGTSYGTQLSFMILPLKDGFHVFPVPVSRGANLQFSATNLQPGYYGLIIHNSMGQQVLTRHFDVQAGFINQSVSIPSSIAPGVYYVRLVNEKGMITSKAIAIF